MILPRSLVAAALAALLAAVVVAAGPASASGGHTITLDLKVVNVKGTDVGSRPDVAAKIVINCGYKRTFWTETIDNNNNPHWRRAAVFFTEEDMTLARLRKECKFTVSLEDIDLHFDDDLGHTKEQRMNGAKLGKPFKLSMKTKSGVRVQATILVQERDSSCEKEWLDFVGDRKVYTKASDILNIFGSGNDKLSKKDALKLAEKVLKKDPEASKEAIERLLGRAKSKLEDMPGHAGAQAKAYFKVAEMYQALGKGLIDAYLGVVHDNTCAKERAMSSLVGSARQGMCGPTGHCRRADTLFTFCIGNEAFHYNRVGSSIVPPVRGCPIPE